jgi:hypothetical protein
MTTVEQLNARLEYAKKKLAQLEADDAKPQFYEHTYPVDIPLPLIDPSSGAFPAAFGTMEVNAGVTFFPLGISASYTVTGILDDGSPATVTVPPSLMPLIFDYTWMMRDSSTDRDWGNISLPSSLMRGGNMTGFRFGRGHGRMSGGTQIIVTINPTFFSASSTATGLAEFTSHSLQVELVGVEVLDGVL